MSIAMEEHAPPLTEPAEEQELQEQEPPKWPKDQITQLRDELFKRGSEFRPTSRSEIVGVDNVLGEIDRLIHWLTHSKEYQGWDARLEPGVIFEGNPGTGKTLISRYIATESRSLFINIREFPHPDSLYKDSDIADLFYRVRMHYRRTGQPIVLFWDEFENVAKNRDSNTTTAEQAATVSQLTAELDGIHGKNEGLLLIGCTNYINDVDEALRRSGRMGLQIEFHAPDREGKEILLKHYLGKHTTKGKIDVGTLSYFFNSRDTAADIEESCMEAWRSAVRRTILTTESNGRNVKPTLTQGDLVEVFLKRLVGPPSTFVNLPDETRARIAVHEVGHAIMALVFDIPLRLITVQPGKKALGRTITAEVDEYLGSLEEMMSDMRVGVGSIAAEARAEIPTGIGSSGDIRQINMTALKIVDNLHGGLQTSLFWASVIGHARNNYNGVSPNVSSAMVGAADADVKALLDQIENDATQVMTLIGKEDLWEIANAVNARTTLTGDQFKELFTEITGKEPSEFRP